MNSILCSKYSILRPQNHRWKFVNEDNITQNSSVSELDLQSLGSLHQHHQPPAEATAADSSCRELRHMHSCHSLELPPQRHRRSSSSGGSNSSCSFANNRSTTRRSFVSSPLPPLPPPPPPLTITASTQNLSEDIWVRREVKVSQVMWLF